MSLRHPVSMTRMSLSVCICHGTRVCVRGEGV